MSVEQIPLESSGATPMNVPNIPRLDKDEFEDAFEVFSKGCGYISKENLPLFLKSIGLSNYIKMDQLNRKKPNELDCPQLKEAIEDVLFSSDPSTRGKTLEEWPSELDVIESFRVFDQEGHGLIPVQQLKRFLLQAQLGCQEEELEKLIRENCKIDNDNQIDYLEFVYNVTSKFTALPPNQN